MADPFSIIALLNTTLKGMISIKDFVSTIQRAPHSINALADDLSAMEGMLRHLGYLVNNSDDEMQMNRMVRESLVNCEKISRQVERLVRPYVKSSSSGVTVWGRITFGFKESEVNKLITEMSACKQTLTIAITGADLLASRKAVRGITRIQNHFGIVSSSVAESDLGDRDYQRISEWNSKNETIVEEEAIDYVKSEPYDDTQDKHYDEHTKTDIEKAFVVDAEAKTDCDEGSEIPLDSIQSSILAMLNQEGLEELYSVACGAISQVQGGSKQETSLSHNNQPVLTSQPDDALEIEAVIKKLFSLTYGAPAPVQGGLKQETSLPHNNQPVLTSHPMMVWKSKL